jgi:hypothetical protein
LIHPESGEKPIGGGGKLMAVVMGFTRVHPILRRCFCSAAGIAIVF